MRICLVSSGLEERNQRLQPWHYLLQVGHSLVQEGHSICLISNGGPSAPLEDNVGGLPVIRLEAWRGQRGCMGFGVAQEIAKQRPDAILWHLGITSFIQPGRLRHFPSPLVGIFTSPVYRPGELLRLGIVRLLRGYQLSAAHLLGLLIPDQYVRHAMDRGGIQGLVVECRTTHRRLVARGIPADGIEVFRPRIDSFWLGAAPPAAGRVRKRQQLGLSPDDFVVGYFGPPAVLRGLPTLLRALSLLQDTGPTIRALILSRHRDGEPGAEALAARRLSGQLRIEHRAHFVSGFLAQDELRDALTACDAIALPFELVPSDVPLSVLEAMALGLPLITTDVACLPELVPDGAGLRVPPANPGILADAIEALARDAALRKDLGTAARQRVMRWQKNRPDGPSWTWLLQRHGHLAHGTDLHLPGRS